jgi:D-alanyl-D-alanine carboxypeptidase
MKNITFWSFLLSFSILLAISSCKKDIDDNSNLILIDQMKSVTDSIIQNTQVPGIVALVVDNKKGIDWLYTAGYSDIPNKLPMDDSYTFRIGSCTKTMTVTILLQLVDEGKIALEDKLSQYFPAYPKSDSITIAMLCDMTSGIADFVSNPQFFPMLDNNPAKVWPPQELAELGVSQNFTFSPGKGWNYSSTNTIILGQVIELVTDNTLEVEMNTRIFEPLNPDNTGFLTSGLTFPGTHGRGYYSGTYMENQDMTEHYDVSWGWAAGSAYSTPRELQKYVEAMVEGGFLSDSLQQKRLNELHVSDNIGDFYGLGLAKRGSFFGHIGGIHGFTSFMFHSKEKNCSVIIYFNCMLEIRPEVLFQRFMDILYGDNY